MSTVSLPRSVSWPSKSTLAWVALLLNTQLLLVLGYLLVTDSHLQRLSALRLYVYPFVWINVSLWALLNVQVPTAPRRRQLLAGALAGGYLLLLSYLGGIVSLMASSGLDISVNVLSIPPGWAPAVIVHAEGLMMTLLPFKVIGYLTLAYLVYVTVLEAAGLLPAVLGLFSCVSCAWAAVVVPLAGAVGSSGALAGFVYAGGYDLSTAVFVLSIVLLTWRPSMATVKRFNEWLGGHL